MDEHTNSSPKTKAERREKTILKELGTIIKQEVDLAPGLFLTITKVEVSPDLNQAKVWVSLYPETDFAKTIALLNAAAPHLQWLLRKRVKIRFIPNLEFKYDSGIVKEARVEKLLGDNKLE